MSSTAPAPVVGSNRLAVPLFVAAEGFSLFGNAAIGIVLPWLVLQRTGEVSVAGLVAAAAGVPAVLAALLGGQLVDRVGQRRMAVLADVGSATAVAALAVVDLVAGLTVGWFVVLGIAGALFDVPGMTARETMMGRVAATGGVALDTLASVRQAVFGLAFLTGPALAGLLLAVLDPVDVVWLTAGCSAAAALCTLALPLVGRATPAEGDDVGGLATVAGSPVLRALLLISFGSAVVVAPVVALLLPAHFAALDSPGLLGLTMSAFAVGSVLGAVGYAVTARRSRRLAYVVGVGLQTLGLALVAVLEGFWVVAAGTAVLGVGSGMLSPIFLVAFTELVPEHVRGRVLGLFNALALVASPLGIGLAALLLTRVPLGTAAVVVVACWSVVALFSLTSRAMRTVVAPRDPTPAPTDPTPQEAAGADDQPAR
ncbi:MFS transporter [Nocardioides nanhaiensis]|uniref:Multidrug efflux pump Tap n=1 Tax=Nocardioides nanhaiensis TaxID=1476871 RepID=A0ABP8WXZ7_9ACTN